ncbi:anti-sigma factor RsbA family regulatory protein [Spirillospora sp. CA-294931]|uniref:anti-sigma factor RsbA family regulatory protein n=1 Tax=Spirillospora sp. CA-294931 TaxID=3240042 RepID=UPI003D906C5B
MTLEHRAFLYSGADDFLAGAAPFLRSGLERDEAVVAVVQKPGLTALRDIFGEKEVEFYDSAEFYLHPVRTLKSYQELVDAKSPRRVCALAEPVWRDQTPRERLEWARYESLINVVFRHSGARALCPYDSDALSSEVLDQARRTHPMVVAGDGPTRDSGDYVDPQLFGAACDRTLRFEHPRGTEYLAIESDDLHTLRSFVGERARAHGLVGQAGQNLVTAANEVAANALNHGVPPIGLWIWPDGPELVCEIGDNGYWRPDSGSLTGYIPPDSALQRGFGLWTVRLLVDLMELRAGWDGTFVRLRVRR